MTFDIERHLVARLDADDVVDLLSEAGATPPSAWSLVLRVRGARRVEIMDVQEVEFVVVEDVEASRLIEKHTRRVRRVMDRLRDRLSKKDWRLLLKLEAELADRQGAVDRHLRERLGRHRR